MSSAAFAVTTVDSAATEVSQPVIATPSTPAFDAADQNTWSREQRTEWNKTGKQPSKADSAPAKETAAADSAPQTKEEKPADSASDSAPDKDNAKPRQKTKEDTERRFSELLDSNKKLQQRLDELERGKTSDKRDSEQKSQPAPEVKVPPLKQFLKDYFAQAENKGKEYEDGVEAWNNVRDEHRTKELEKQVRSQLAQEAAQRDLSSKVQEAKTRYPDFDQRVMPAVDSIMTDQQIPFAVKAVLNDSPDFVDLMYTLSEPAALKDLIATAKQNPAAAIRKIVLVEQLVQAELAKGKTAKADGADKTASGEGAQRDASGKFVKAGESSDDKGKTDAASETKPRAPKPPSEVGGRGTATEDVLRSAAQKGDFRSFEAEQNRRMKARQA